MTEEQILEQLFDNGYVVKQVQFQNKFNFTIKSLTAKDYYEIDNVLQNSKGTQLYTLQKYGVAKLSKCLQSYNGKTFNNSEEVREFLETLATPIVDKMLKEHIAFEKEIEKAVDPDKVEKNFFEEPGLAEKQEQLQKVSTSESQAS